MGIWYSQTREDSHGSMVNFSKYMNVDHCMLVLMVQRDMIVNCCKQGILNQTVSVKRWVSLSFKNDSLIGRSYQLIELSGLSSTYFLNNPLLKKRLWLCCFEKLDTFLTNLNSHSPPLTHHCYSSLVNDNPLLVASGQSIVRHSSPVASRINNISR